ncbi:hypothetical protein [Arthrobacter sp. CJ23]|uniref:hypothetical protein n=1 Tax=Arthrobacter sp. CJ23 TaxID=2972479 RepID=UPI00215BBD57|nr:hypothetical protein [Arthrobacter sp. CJ23]UVJ40247.1 hypothetical protein NVV90_03405 [Arthrobacter sp. CJ23]
MTIKRNTPQDATQHALKLVLAAAEEDWPTYKALCVDVNRRNVRFAGDVILAMTVISANAVKTAHPDSWNAFLRLNIHDVDIDPAQWGPDTKDNK